MKSNSPNTSALLQEFQHSRLKHSRKPKRNFLLPITTSKSSSSNSPKVSSLSLRSSQFVTPSRKPFVQPSRTQPSASSSSGGHSRKSISSSSISSVHSHLPTSSRAAGSSRKFVNSSFGGHSQKSTSSSTSSSCNSVSSTSKNSKRESFSEGPFSQLFSPLETKAAPKPKRNFLLSAQSPQNRNEDVNSYLGHVNDKQKEAVLADNVPVMILASPGSGKTLTLTTRILHLLKQGVPGREILVITFTRKAADEMKSRVETLIGWQSAAGITICNFHQLCLRILRENYQAIGFKHQFSVLGASDQREIIAKCIAKWEASKNQNAEGKIEKLEKLDFDADAIDDQFIDDTLGKEDGGRRFPPRAPSKASSRAVKWFTSFVRKAKQLGKGPRDFPDERGEIYEEYIKMLKIQAAIDFSDMIPLTLVLFKRVPRLLAVYQERYRYVLCDEFQDVSKDQFHLLKLLCIKGKNITVCGDDDQSIFGWRGGTIECFQMFKETFPTHRCIILDQSYRSSRRIVQAYTSLISANQGRVKKSIWTENPEGEKIRLLVCKERKSEAESICKEISKIQKAGTSFGEIAVLARTRKVLVDMQTIMKSHGIPVSSSYSGNQHVWQRSKEILDMLAYCELILSDTADRAFARIYNTPKRGIGQASLERISVLASSQNKSYFEIAQKCSVGVIAGFGKKQKKSLGDLTQLIRSLRRSGKGGGVENLIIDLVDRIGYRDHIAKYAKSTDALNTSNDNLLQLLSWSQNFDRERSATLHSEEQKSDAPSKAESIDLPKFIKSLKSSVKLDEKQNDRKHVTLSTIHQAKGRGWDVVFLKSFNEGVLPLPVRAQPEEKPRASKGHKNGSSQGPGATGSQKSQPHSGSSQSVPSTSQIQRSRRAIADEIRSIKFRTELNQMEEERRLAYVAMSRPRKKLILSFILIDESGVNMMNSRFLNEIPESLIESFGPRTVLAPQSSTNSSFLPKFKTASGRTLPTSRPGQQVSRQGQQISRPGLTPSSSSHSSYKPKQHSFKSSKPTSRPGNVSASYTQPISLPKQITSKLGNFPNKSNQQASRPVQQSFRINNDSAGQSGRLLSKPDLQSTHLNHLHSRSAKQFSQHIPTDSTTFAKSISSPSNPSRSFASPQNGVSGKPNQTSRKSSQSISFTKPKPLKLSQKRPASSDPNCSQFKRPKFGHFQSPTQPTRHNTTTVSSRKCSSQNMLCSNLAMLGGSASNAQQSSVSSRFPSQTQSSSTRNPDILSACNRPKEILSRSPVDNPYIFQKSNASTYSSHISQPKSCQNSKTLSDNSFQESISSKQSEELHRCQKSTTDHENQPINEPGSQMDRVINLTQIGETIPKTGNSKLKRNSAATKELQEMFGLKKPHKRKSRNAHSGLLSMFRPKFISGKKQKL
eukprot:113951_1